MTRKIRTIAYMGLLFALAVVLSFVEGLFPGVPGLPPGVKLGLSNIVTMYCLFFLGGKKAYLLAVLKSVFVFLTRGAVACVLSLTGGVLSVTVMLLLLCLKKANLSYFAVSVAGAIFHNLGQLAAASLILQTVLSLYYLPVLLVSGVVMGAVTGTVLRTVLPALQRIDPAYKRDG